MFKQSIQKMNASIIDTSMGSQEALRNLKNGYIALAMSLVMTIAGYIASPFVFGSLFQNIGGFGAVLMFVFFMAMIFAIEAMKNSIWGLVLLLAFGFIEGAFLFAFISNSAPGAVLGALLGTIAIFIATTLVAMTGKIDSSGWGKYLFVTLLGLVVTMLVNVFMQSTALQLFLSSAVVVVMAGFMVYDTQNALKYPRKSYISIALGFYLNIINIFVNLLSIIGIMDD